MDEFYNFTWYGKTNAVKEADTPTNKKMVACREESVDFDNTNNLFIEGDNLDALKLLRKQYAGKVKMIYIDPPYNTGNKFLYKDNFNLKGKDLSNGDKRHAGWLNMMYPRLKLARELLRKDGVIFISIGVKELSNLKNICDEIFKEENFIEVFTWVKTCNPPNTYIKTRKKSEYILCYEKNKSKKHYIESITKLNDQPLISAGNNYQKIKLNAKDVYFSYLSNGEIKKGYYGSVYLHNDITIKNNYATSNFCLSGEFKWVQSFIDKEVQQGTSFVIKSELLSVRYIRKQNPIKKPDNLVVQHNIETLLNKKTSNVLTNESAKKEIQNLFNCVVLKHTKPISLPYYLSKLVTQKNDIILDFFAGSATTAHAVMQRNVEENHQCQFIMVQLPEVCDETSEAFKSGYSTIAEISKERIRRAAKQIKEKHPKTKADLGFKVFKLID